MELRNIAILIILAVILLWDVCSKQVQGTHQVKILEEQLSKAAKIPSWMSNAYYVCKEEAGDHDERWLKECVSSEIWVEASR